MFSEVLSLCTVSLRTAGSLFVVSVVVFMVVVSLTDRFVCFT